MKKVIAIYFSDPEPMGYPFHKEQYLSKYKEIITEVEKAGIAVHIVRGESYNGDGIFSHGWHFEGDELISSEGEIKADLIFNKDDKNTIPAIHDCKIINQPEFDDLCVDKMKTFEAFPDISPKTSYIHSYKGCTEQLASWDIAENELIVLKKNFETNGRGIFIIPVAEVKEELHKDWSDILIQEFLDSSIGIPGITEGLHDLRVTVVNGKPINAFLRVPKEGTLIANISRGAVGTSINITDVPQEVMDLVQKIDTKVQTFFPAAYGADFVRSPKGYKLIELNSRPGIQHPDWQKTYQLFNDAIIKMLVEAVA